MGRSTGFESRAADMESKKLDVLKFWLVLLCGTWAFGLGFRYSLELLVSDGWIHIPKYAGMGVNLWFDFALLSAFGLFTVVIALTDMFRRMKKEKCAE